MKYRVGDRVKIKSLSWFEKNKILRDGNYCIILSGNKFFSHEMIKYCGKYAKIVDYNSEDTREYYLDIDKDNHYWTKDMFDSMRKEKLNKLKEFEKDIDN